MHEPDTCRIIIDIRDDKVEEVRAALPLDFRIMKLPPHPHDPEGAGWRLFYRGPWTIERDDALASFSADVVVSWSRVGLPTPRPGGE